MKKIINPNDYEYVHIGNSTIEKSMHLDIINNGIKPLGGYWSSPNNKIEGSVSDWTDFVLENKNEKFLRFDYTKGCFFNLKSDAKLLFLTKDKEYEQAKEKWSKDNFLDYESISQEYDAVFVNPYALSYELRHTKFHNWDVRTLLIFNLNCIKEYIPFEFKIVKGQGFYITKIGDIITLKPLPSHYQSIKYFIYQLFLEKLQKQSNLDNIEITLDQIKSELMDEYKKIIPEQEFNILETIIINETNKQKKKIRQ